MATVRINYDKDTLDYKSVVITYDFNKKVKSFDSGDFVRDWYDATKFRMVLDKVEFDFKELPSVNNFDFLTNKFDRAYLKRSKNEFYLKYDVKEYDHFSVKYYVKAGTTPTWDELRKICGDKKISKIKLLEKLWQKKIFGFFGAVNSVNGTPQNLK